MRGAVNWINFLERRRVSVEHELDFWVEVFFKNGPPCIKAVRAQNAIAAHRAVWLKYGEQYAGSGILGNTPQSRLIYIASPYAGDIAGNTRFAIRCCQFAIQRGYTPIAPHLIYPQMLDDTIPEQRKLGLALGYRLLEACSEMWVCGERISNGMAAEIHHAEVSGIHIRYIRQIEES